ncbi:DEAD/DEAH box helicase family protein [Streptomyces noursei]|uniref:DEAD/DEAH box helicase family protein n=1 Tax=Streptomyces noursei TaxID=1971 RepID=UPI003DA6882E
MEDRGVQVTTDPRELAELVRYFRVVGQSYTVLTTYASVETIIAAHKLRADRDGVAALPRWDLLVADEAHHTETSKTWGRINSHRLVPAVHRLAMTATPRLMGGGEPGCARSAGRCGGGADVGEAARAGGLPDGAQPGAAAGQVGAEPGGRRGGGRSAAAGSGGRAGAWR